MLDADLDMVPAVAVLGLVITIAQAQVPVCTKLSHIQLQSSLRYVRVRCTLYKALGSDLCRLLKKPPYMAVPGLLRWRTSLSIRNMYAPFPFIRS